MFQILVVEDEKNAAQMMKSALSQAGYEVISVGSGEQAWEMMDVRQIDLLILSVTMPKTDGFSFVRRLRSCGNMVPIVMTSERNSQEEICRGFLAGTDDYMVKPIHAEELILRIRALLRRAQLVYERKLRIGNITLDYDGLTVTRNGDSQTLPKKEFYLLYKLLSSPDKIMTRIQLMDEIWGMESNTVDTTVNTHISRLRRKFGSWPEFDIVAIRGIGYKAVIHPDADAKG